MSGKPRSSLKKRLGGHDDRRVSFASPLSSEKQDSPLCKHKLPNSITAKTTPTAAKRQKPERELIDIITLVNQQSEVIEEIFEIENKLAKQSSMAQNLTINLTEFIESIANLSSDSTKIKLEFGNQKSALNHLEGRINDLVRQAKSICAEYDSRISAEAQYASGFLELQNSLKCVNCTDIDLSDDSHVDYDNLLSMIEHLERYTDKF
uniref:Uncharacterized protein n=1 Tax=Caenorhabditis tropicalis TaxID=1561998 RepID=A0A1I7UI04_9PELO